MPLKTWQYTLAFVLHALTNLVCAYFLAPAHTKAGTGGWSHRTLRLVLLAVLNSSVGVLVWAKPKRQVFFLSLASSIALMVWAADSVWKCTHIHAGVKMAGALICLVVLAYMREVAAHLRKLSRATQLTWVQTIFLLGLALDLVGYLSAPGWKLWAVIEIVLWSGLAFEGWTHFIAFERTVKDTFGQVKAVYPIQSVPPSPPPPQFPFSTLTHTPHCT
jgi:hypothetical protein